MDRLRKNPGIKVLFVCALIAIPTIGCDLFERDKWVGTFYPHGDLSDSRQWKSGGPFPSEEACLAWARSLVSSDDDDYECNKRKDLR